MRFLDSGMRQKTKNTTKGAIKGHRDHPAQHGPRRRKLAGDELELAAGRMRHPDLARLLIEWEEAELGAAPKPVTTTVMMAVTTTNTTTGPLVRATQTELF